MTIRHVVTIQVASGKASEFAGAFKALQAVVRLEEGCEQYELFQSFADSNRLIILERWTNRVLLQEHMETERTRDPSPVERLLAPMAQGSTPIIERFED